MQETIEQIITLQRAWSDKTTPEMARRGVLIRDVLPEEIRRIGHRLRAALGQYGDDADAEGRDGTGRKTHVPWVRWHSEARSPSAQVGWYIVYLFHPDGAGVSLCLSHGSTTFRNGSFVSRGEEEVAELMAWAASVVGTEFDGDTAVRRGIILGQQELARAYEKTTVFSKFYQAGAIPLDAELEQDLVRFCEPLRKLYRAQELGLAPGDPHVDVTALEAEVQRIASPLRVPNKGQGRGLPAPLRKLVEMHAMDVARRWLKREGFTFEDVSATQSCDFRARKHGEEWIIEVKGTTGGPGSILLTRNEVALHRQAHPKNALLVVHGIDLDVDAVKVSGGELLSITPWRVEDERLNAICFEYRLGNAPGPEAL